MPSVEGETDPRLFIPMSEVFVTCNHCCLDGVIPGENVVKTQKGGKIVYCTDPDSPLPTLQSGGTSRRICFKSLLRTETPDMLH